MQSQTIQGDTPSTKPDGGYVQISTLILAAIWWAYSEGLLSLRAVRVGLALFELRIRRAVHALIERRKGNRSDLVAKYTAKELGDFCGLPTKRAAAALQELLKLGILVEFEETHFLFAPSPAALALTPEQRSAFERWFALLTKRRKIPVGRRILALACESSSPALIAVILGVCLRCSWKKPEGMSYSGRVSCTWLARCFRLSLRAVQSAKQHLVSLKWIERRGDIGRLGERIAINPAWGRLLSLPEVEREKHQDHGAGGVTPPVSPPAAHSGETLPPAAPPETGTIPAGSPAPAGTISAGFSFTRESSPSGNSKDQRESRAERPDGSASPGIYFREPSKESPKNAASAVDAKALPPPRLSNIRPEDFSDTGRALELFRQAVKCHLVPNDSEHSRLLWLAAIERARTAHDVKNPAGVFLFIVKNRKFDFLSDGHFDAANERLKKFLYAPPPGSTPFLVPALGRSVPPAEPPRPKLSRDALLLKTVREGLARRGLDASVFATLRSHAGWDRDRYGHAVAELEAAEKGPSLQANAV